MYCTLYHMLKLIVQYVKSQTKWHSRVYIAEVRTLNCVLIFRILLAEVPYTFKTYNVVDTSNLVSQVVP